MKKKLLLVYAVMAISAFIGVNQFADVMAAEDVPAECLGCSISLRQYGMLPAWGTFGCPPDSETYHWYCWLTQDQNRCCCNIAYDCVEFGE